MDLVPPEWLCPEARDEWDRMVPQLLARNVLTRLDQTMVARYCQTWAVWRQSVRDLDKIGQIYLPKGGKIAKQNPAMSIYLQSANDLLRMEQEMGLTPVSRQRLDIKEKETGDKGKSRFFPERPHMRIAH